MLDRIVPLASGVAGVVLAYNVWTLLRLLSTRFTSPLRKLPGPKNSHWLAGNREMFGVDSYEVQLKLKSQYGSTYTFHDFFGQPRLYTTDVKALSHVIMHGDTFVKAERGRKKLAKLMGEGLLFVEGEKHKVQRRVMNPAFGPVQLRALTEVIMERSNALRDCWLAEIAKSAKSAAHVDVLTWLSRMTLDTIGKAGFNYDFHSLDPDGKPNELNDAFTALFGNENKYPFLAIMSLYFPILEWIPTRQRLRIASAKSKMHQIGRALLARSKSDVVEKEGSGKARDLLSLLVRANHSAGAAAEQMMTDDDVLAQIPTFLVAGHETTSTATAWALYSLSQSPKAQTTLRDEIRTMGTDTPTMEDLNSLPYLDAVVREAMRLHAPVPFAQRVAAKDEVLPLAEPFVDAEGKKHDSVRVGKGDPITIPIMALNRSTDIWGPDAAEFRPERWTDVPAAAHSVPGIWGNQMTFMGGPRACIGYRLSLLETKALLFSLVKTFEIELAVPAQNIRSKMQVVRRPMVVADGETRVGMPMIIRLAKDDF